MIDINEKIGDTGILGIICFLSLFPFFLSEADINDKVGDTGLLGTIRFLFFFKRSGVDLATR